eukprot:2367482-Ditylum_brightwellii.AAC.1
MSGDKGKERFFVVSNWFLDFENNKFSFTKEFIDSLVPNTPTVIEDRMKNNLVQVIKNVQKNYVRTIIPTKVDGVLKFQATLGNGAKEMVRDEWLKENFCTMYNYVYNDLHDQANVGTNLDLPE